MPDPKSSLLIVEDDAFLRISLSQIFAGFGYVVRSASDGFSALLEIRQMVPDLILSDLYMPGMSGFELLSVVRRRFPAIKLIAMSGAFSSAGVPPGLAADAFYEKGTSLGTLLHIANELARMRKPPSVGAPSTSEATWIPMNGHDPSGDPFVTIACPECLRTFPQVLCNPVPLIRETECIHCLTLIHFAIVEHANRTSLQLLQPKVGAEMEPPHMVNPTYE
jgi:CheY-like chemotaxis protein